MSLTPHKFAISGFAAAAEDAMQPALDLNQYVSNYPSSTFYMQVSGNANSDLDIFDGDILVIDRSLLPRKNKKIIVVRNDEFKIIKLSPKDSLDCQIEYWGTVTHLIRKLK